MKRTQIVLNAEQAVAMAEKSGPEALVVFFEREAKSQERLSSVDDDTDIILDTEEALEIIRKGGADAFAVWVCIRAVFVGRPSVVQISNQLGIPRERTEKALYRLGLVSLGVVEEQNDHARFEHAGA